MGYPMTYTRVLMRNQLTGDYDPAQNPKAAIAGDLRRLEADQRDEAHLRAYAEHAGVTPEQADAVLDLFFKGGALT